MKILLHLFFLSLSAILLSADPFQKGSEAYHASEYEKAQSFFKEALRQEESAAAHHNLALALYQTQQVSLAAWHLERALLLDPLNEEYHFKLGALRQVLSLPNTHPEWYLIGSRILSPSAWIAWLAVAFWLSLGAFLLPLFGRFGASLSFKAMRLIGPGILILSGIALYLNRDLPARGIFIVDTPTTLHAAPASAAPQSGLCRPGERGRVLDQHGEYLKVITEGEARGWIRNTEFRRIQDRS